MALAKEYVESLGWDNVLFDSSHDKCYCIKCYPASWSDMADAGGQKYVIPRGWARIGLHVDAAIVGVNDIWNKWIVTFHGTSLLAAKSILHNRQFCLPGDKLIDGTLLGIRPGHIPDKKHIYTSPTIAYSGLPVYSTKHDFNSSKNYCAYTVQIVLQCRQKPGSYTVQGETVNAPQCTSSIAQQYSCQCNCCNTGSASCSPSYVGTSVAYTCASGSCSISCAQQYPSQCISNQNGQTQGQCMGPITTTTTTTTVGPWLGNTCSCMCCQSGSSCTPTYVGITSASQCSLTACNQACQIRYPSVRPSLYILGQTSGTCTGSTTSGTTRCACSCCGTNGCFNHDIRTNEGCTTCNSLCQSQSQCTNPSQVTQTCYLNNAKTFHPWIIFILSIIFFNFFVLTDFI
ncbi:unnamed protein product [Adineta steineri]|uniref:Uncharacterized protein n=1 Tax=Adineta steineri TaxID=433720 RepID=A0A814T5C8_9BILA|nr:unnamed protein product [Adineta steineri]